MGEASEGRSRRAMEALSLLQRFSEESKVAVGEEEGSEEIEVNLNLGLSLGGRFGVDKSSSSKLVRSSSIAGSIPVLSGSAPALARTASLPVETEEQWRKRKELQSLRRMEAKRRRSEKQRTSSAAAPPGLEEIDGEDLKEKQHFATANRSGSAGLPSWAAAARTAAAGAGGSVETVGGSSSGNSELESKTSQGRSSCGEARSSAGSIQRNQEQIEKAQKNECRAPTGREGAMEDMPCVFTKGDGPDGRRVDGILYKYGKGEEVRIMCVCHGSFLSPADFVKHAGGRDVSHPLRHIVINPSASTSLS